MGRRKMGETESITKNIKVAKNGPSTLIVRITDIASVLSISEGDIVEVTIKKLKEQPTE